MDRVHLKMDRGSRGHSRSGGIKVPGEYPKVRFGSWRVAMTGETMTQEDGNKNDTLMNCLMVGGDRVSLAGGGMGEEVVDSSGMREESGVGVVGEGGVEGS